jgi:UDP-N-acetyl-D-glucosamine dehydrogenase
MEYRVDLQEKINSNSTVVGVIGLGYVGLPLLAAFSRVGFPVMEFDAKVRVLS